MFNNKFSNYNKIDDEYNNISSLLLKMEIEKSFFDFISSNNPFLNYYYYDYFNNNNNNNNILNRTEFQNAILNNRNNIYPFNNYYCNNLNSYNESQFVHDTNTMKEYEPTVPFFSENNNVLFNINKSTTTTTTGSPCMCHSPLTSDFKKKEIQYENEIINDTNLLKNYKMMNDITSEINSPSLNISASSNTLINSAINAQTSKFLNSKKDNKYINNMYEDNTYENINSLKEIKKKNEVDRKLSLKNTIYNNINHSNFINSTNINQSSSSLPSFPFNIEAEVNSITKSSDNIKILNNNQFVTDISYYDNNSNNIHPTTITTTLPLSSNIGEEKEKNRKKQNKPSNKRKDKKKKLESKISINKLISNNMKTIQKKNTKKRNLKNNKIEAKRTTEKTINNKSSFNKERIYNSMNSCPKSFINKKYNNSLNSVVMMASPTNLNNNIKETGKKNRGGNIKRKKRPNHPPEVINILKKWLQENKDTYPYPSNTEKSKLCESTGLSLTQINNWFINARRRYV